jgi:hypothetical protein
MLTQLACSIAERDAQQNSCTGSMGRGPFGVMKLYTPFPSVRQPGHRSGPTRPSLGRFRRVRRQVDQSSDDSGCDHQTRRDRGYDLGAVSAHGGGSPWRLANNQSGGAGPRLQTDREGRSPVERLVERSSFLENCCASNSSSSSFISASLGWVPVCCALLIFVMPAADSRRSHTAMDCPRAPTCKRSHHAEPADQSGSGHGVGPRRGGCDKCPAPDPAMPHLCSPAAFAELHAGLRFAFPQAKPCAPN